jgi:hypothetical protein
MGASASFEQSSISVEPGGQAEVRLRVRNTGGVVDSFSFEPVGIPPEWVSVSPAEVRLFPETEEHVTVTVMPPLSSDTPLGELTFALRVISAEDPEGSVAEELTLMIAEFGKQGGELHPKTSTGRTKGVHELAVDNHGNTAINPEFTGIDVDNLLTFEIKPPTVTVEPGTAAIAIVTVSPRKRFWRGKPKTLPFQVSVVDGENEPILLDGNFVQQPLVPKWLWKALLALLVLLLLFWLLWQTLLKPTVESAARDSVEAFVEEEVEAIDERLDAAGIPEIGEAPPADGGGGATTTTTTTTVTGTTTTTIPVVVPVTTVAPPDEGTTTTTTTTEPQPLESFGPVDFRIALEDPEGGPGTSDFQPVPIGTRLEITDIVFQNPTGALGGIIVRRAGVPLFELQMANFRDLDYHFVAPYVFEGGENVEVVLVCLARGTLEPINTPVGSCRAAVSFAGFNTTVTTP